MGLVGPRGGKFALDIAAGDKYAEFLVIADLVGHQMRTIFVREGEAGDNKRQCRANQQRSIWDNSTHYFDPQTTARGALNPRFFRDNLACLPQQPSMQIQELS